MIAKKQLNISLIILIAAIILFIYLYAQKSAQFEVFKVRQEQKDIDFIALQSKEAELQAQKAKVDSILRISIADRNTAIRDYNTFTQKQPSIIQYNEKITHTASFGSAELQSFYSGLR